LLKAIPHIVKHVTVAWSVRLSECRYVVSGNTVLDWGPGPPTERGDLGIEIPSSQRRRPNAKLRYDTEIALKKDRTCQFSLAHKN